MSTINLKNVFFQTGSATLAPNSKWELDNVASLLKANPNVKVELSGHTDSAGDDGANMDLSNRRAQAALDYLQNKGLGLSRMTSKGYGENNPINTNETPEGRQVNRRTELKILAK